MKTAIYQEALDAFANPFHEFSIEELGKDCTNDSYKVTSRLNSRSFLLQQINREVFSSPAHVQENYEMLWKYLQTEHIPFNIPEPKYFPDDSTLYVDSNDHYWRVFEFIPGGQVFCKAETVAQARAVAQTFSSFTTSFEDFDLSTLHQTIPQYHDLSHRVKLFHKALHSGQYERLAKAAPLVDELKKRERYASFYDVLTESEEFKPRVIHHDATIANVIFDNDSENVICLVDLDTVMPGYYFSDLGEMIRCMAVSKDVNSIALNDLTIKKDFYDAIINGYLSVIDYQLTEAERKYVHYSGIMMIYLKTLHYLTDYLENDSFYQTQYRGQNLDRAQNQLTVLKRLEDFLLKEHSFKV